MLPLIMCLKNQRPALNTSLQSASPKRLRKGDADRLHHRSPEVWNPWALRRFNWLEFQSSRGRMITQRLLRSWKVLGNSDLTCVGTASILKLRRRRSLISAQGSSIARTLGTYSNCDQTLKGFASRGTLSGFRSTFDL